MLRLWFLCSWCVLAGAAEFHVTPGGEETLESARDKARSAPGSTVWIHGGTYLRSATFTLGEADSGTTFRAWKDEIPRIVEARALEASKFRRVTDQAVVARLAPAARGKVVALDLGAAGVQHQGPYPDLFEDNGKVFELYFDGKRMPLSRWPNGGYTTMGKIVDGKGVFTYRGDHPAAWRGALADGVWVAGFWRVPWAIQSVRVESIDAEQHTIKLAKEVPGGIGSKYSKTENGSRVGDGKEPWYALNLQEEIDEPGEWAVNFKAHTLYWWPPAAVESAPVWIADFTNPAIALNGASHVVLRGLVIEGTLGAGIRMEGGEENVIAGCTVRNTGGAGIEIVSGKGNGVLSSDVYDNGAEGIVLGGGDRKTLTAAGNFVRNTHVHHYGRVKRSVSGILVSGVGNVVERCLLHDAPYGGVRYTGNEHKFERNEIHNIGLDGGDLGAFYSTMDWASRGNLMRQNFVHHAPGANAFYMDDGHSGDRIEWNVVYQVGVGVFISGGHDNVATGNMIIDSKVGIHLDDRGIDRGYTASSKGHVQYLHEYRYQQPPWSFQYPQLARILEFHPESPTGNLLKGNDMIGCDEAMRLRARPENVEFNEVKPNRVFQKDPDLLDPVSLEFRKKTPIRLDAIGLFPDEFRKSLPDTKRNEMHPARQVFDSVVDMEAGSRGVR
jgi:parallel beta-helix repeat protein